MVDTRIFYHAARGGSTPVMPAPQGGRIFPVPQGRAAAKPGSPLRGGRMGGAGGVSRRAQARDSSLHFVPLRMTKYCTQRHTLFCHPAVTALPPVILRSVATKDLARARFTAHPLRGGSVPPTGQSKAGGTGAHCAPLRGGTHSPPCCNSGWVAAVLRDNAFTREARPEGKGVDSQEGENRRCSPSCAQCGRAGRVPARDARAVPQRLSRRPPPHLTGAVPYKDLSVSPLTRRSTSPQRGGRLGSADGVGGNAQARDPSSLRSSG